MWDADFQNLVNLQQPEWKEFLILSLQLWHILLGEVTPHGVGKLGSGRRDK